MLEGIEGSVLYGIVKLPRQYIRKLWKGVQVLKKSRICGTGAKMILKVFEFSAVRNVKERCKGLLYEPEVPKKFSASRVVNKSE